MIFDKDQCLKLVGGWLTSGDRRRTDHLELSMGAALDELANRLRSKSYLSSYETTVAAAAREKELTGDNDNLRHIFALTLGTGAYYRVLIYREPGQFLRDHNDPEESAGRPNYFTQLEASAGFPTVRFSSPLIASETLKVYYWEDLTPDNLSAARSMTVVASGTAAYFYGPASEQGAGYHAMFRELAALSRAADSFLPNIAVKLGLSQEDKAVRQVIRNLQLDRR